MNIFFAYNFSDKKWDKNFNWIKTKIMRLISFFFPFYAIRQLIFHDKNYICPNYNDNFTNVEELLRDFFDKLEKAEEYVFSYWNKLFDRMRSLPKILVNGSISNISRKLLKKALASTSKSHEKVLHDVKVFREKYK